MSVFTAPEPGWYEQDPSAPGGWRKVSDYEASAWERNLLLAPDDRPLVRYAAIDGQAVAWSASDGSQVLPNGQVIPSRTATIVLFDTEPAEGPGWPG